MRKNALAMKLIVKDMEYVVNALDITEKIKISLLV
jgi:hypothetical protein